MYCNKCGTKVMDEEARFCPNCGMKLKVEPRVLPVSESFDHQKITAYKKDEHIETEMRSTKFKNSRSLFWPITIAVFFLLISIIVGSTYFYYQKKLNNAASLKDKKQNIVLKAKAIPASTKIKNSNVPMNLKGIIQEVQKDVVMVEVDNSKLGSGFLYNKNGDVITNAHVVEGATNVKITTSDSRKLEGTVIGISKDVDIAVIRVPDMANSKPLIIGNKKAEIGDEVLALGSPLGLQNTVTTGIISGVGRDFDIAPFHYSDTYQISAPIAPGNSGGPLINSKTGEVLGINTAKLDQGDIGFSLPIVDVLSLVESWSKTPMTDISSSSTSTTGNENNQNTSFVGAAQDLVNSFYQSINSEDYITAYSLLGSSWQKEMAYTNFRNGYLNTVSSSIDIFNTVNNGDSVTVTGIISAQEGTPANYVNSKYQVDYTIGYENGQLKILHGNSKKNENNQTSSFEESAQDLVKTFYQSINSRDYVSAYSLLGGSWQKEMDYNNFRNGYLNTASSNFEILNTVNNGDSATVSGIITAQEGTQANYANSKYQADYTIGYENGQLKILHGNAKKVQ